MVTQSEDGYIVSGDKKIHETFVVPNNKFIGVMYGLELEFFTVDKNTFAPRVMDISCLNPDYVKPELAAEQIEVTTTPHESLRDMKEELLNHAVEVVREAGKQDIVLLPVPLLEQQLTVRNSQRYNLLVQELGKPFAAHAPRVASDQVNIGAHHEQEAFQIFNGLRKLLPALVAVSAASPFYHSSLDSRLAVYDAAIGTFPALTGIPPEIANLEDYARLLEALPVFQHPNMFYKYMRPMPQRGVAAEIRCVDKQPTIERTIALAALCKGFVAAFQRGFDMNDVAGELFPAVNGESDDAQLNARFDIARHYGNLIGKDVYSSIVTSFRDYLPADERPLIIPLIDICPAASMLDEHFHGRTVNDIYHRVAERFEQEVKR